MDLLKPVRTLGRSLLIFLSSFGAGALILGDALTGLVVGNVRARDRITAQMALVGFESLPIVMITALFGGMVLGLQTAKQLVLFGAGHMSVGWSRSRWRANWRLPSPA